MFVEPQPYVSFGFAYVGRVRAVAQHARDLIHYVFRGAVALHPRHTRIAGFVARWAFGWVEC